MQSSYRQVRKSIKLLLVNFFKWSHRMGYKQNNGKLSTEFKNANFKGVLVSFDRIYFQAIALEKWVMNSFVVVCIAM